jgi:hypothetical protein
VRKPNGIEDDRHGQDRIDRKGREEHDPR